MGLKSMNAGDGETSYARNSGLQKTVITKTLPVLDETLKDMFKALNGFPKGMKMADLGCATGPNTLFFVSHMIDTIQDLCEQNNLPQLEVFLNDLPDNDFNNLFKLLPSFNENKKKLECFMYGVPGSFYDRLFPTKSLHFVYSSYSLHWLSQVPEGVGKNNKENIYMAVSSPPQVLEAYAKQFQRDFFRFLSFRGQEIVVGGRMVLTFIARSLPHFSPNDGVAQLFSPLAEILLQMVAQGCVKAEDLYRFNVPVYTPCLQEIEAIVSEQGSFHLDQMETCEVPWDASYDVDKVLDKHRSGKLVADCVRAFMEPILLSHFGTCLNLDRLFHCYADKMADHLSTQTSSYFSPVISLTRSYNYNDCMKCAEGRKCP